MNTYVNTPVVPPMLLANLEVTPMTLTRNTTRDKKTKTLVPKFLGSIMDPQQISEGRPHAFFFSILF